MNQIKYSFVIPAFNEEENIPLIFRRIVELSVSLDGNWELIFINDGSSDQTLEVLKKLASENNQVKYIDLSRNFGHQAALTSGLAHAKGDVIISMDCDLQDPPEIILRMIEKWKDGNDIVYARRIERHDSFFKKYTAIGYYKILDKFSNIRVPRNVGDFRLMNRRSLNELLKLKEKSIYLRGMVSWLGFKYDFVDFNRPERIHGKTGYSLRKMVKLAMDGLLNFSLLPLKIGFVIGFISIFIGFFFIGYMVYDTIFNNNVYQLIKWLVVVLFIFIGFLFILLWIVGEYIGRIYEESKNRPIYVIRETGNI